MTKVAHDVAQTVHQAYQAMEFHEWVQLGAEQSEITLAVRKPTPEQAAYAETVLKKPEDAKRYHVREKNYAQRVLQLHESPDEVVAVLQAFRVGDLGICAIPFEVFVEIGLELKETSPLARR